MASVGSTPMRDAYKLAAYELAAYEMAYVRGMLMRCTPTMRHTYKMARVRGTPMRWPMEETRLRWPMGDTRLWERHAYERCTHMRDAHT